jgi:ABC-type multidrug transport system fused ATPase/permease subunit
MRRTASPYPVADRPTTADTHLAATLSRLLPYLWQHKWRVVLALSCLVGAKIANVGVPLIFKEMIDDLSSTQQMVVPARRAPPALRCLALLCVVVRRVA